MSVEAYRKSYGEYEDAKRQVAELSGVIESVGTALSRDPENFYFSNTGSGVSFSELRESTKGIDATKWRSASEIMNLVSDLRQKKKTMLQLWASIPDKDRVGLSDPGIRR